MSTLAALTLMLAAPTPQADTLPLPQLVSGFRSICLEKIADAPAQRSVATAAPWNFAPAKEPSWYRSGAATLHIDPATQTCALTAPVASSETVASVQAALSDIVPPDNWQAMPDADSRHVLIALEGSGTEFVIAFKISNKSGRNLTTLYVVKR